MTRSAARALALLCTLAGCTRVAPDSSPSLARTEWASARIIVAADGLAHRPGEEVFTQVMAVNTSTLTRTYWIGFSVQDPAGTWYDLTPVSVTLRPGETSAAKVIRWTIPVDPTPPSGSYRVVAAVWDGRPGAGSRRLDNSDQPAAFSVGTAAQGFAAGGATWHAGNHALGRGTVRPANLVLGEPILLRLPGGSCDGAELRSDGRYGEGVYTIRMKTPLAPGSLSAFFLYEDVRGGNDEVDIEIPNDGSRRVLLNVWVRGDQTHRAELRLPFDPAAGYHDYTIELRQDRLRFLADGALLREFTSRLPTRPMRVMANLWWPRWMECSRAEGEMLVERVRVGG